jgi:hypothetical protein
LLSGLQFGSELVERFVQTLIRCIGYAEKKKDGRAQASDTWRLLADIPRTQGRSFAICFDSSSQFIDSFDIW